VDGGDIFAQITGPEIILIGIL